MTVLRSTNRPDASAHSATRPGFSLLEVATVMLILGILAAIAVPRISTSIARQRVDAAARRIVVA